MEIEVKEGYPIVPFSLIRTGEVFRFAKNFYVKTYSLSIPTGICNAIGCNNGHNAYFRDDEVVERIKAKLVIEPYGNCG